MVTMFFAQPIVDSFSMHANIAKGYQLLHGNVKSYTLRKTLIMSNFLTP